MCDRCISRDISIVSITCQLLIHAPAFLLPPDDHTYYPIVSVIFARLVCFISDLLILCITGSILYPTRLFLPVFTFLSAMGVTFLDVMMIITKKSLILQRIFYAVSILVIIIILYSRF